jgi:hypothetical protein
MAGAANYAWANHQALMHSVREVFADFFGKGLLRGRASYVLAGTARAMEETFGSTCHGAGRVLSRTAAPKAKHGAQVRKEHEAQGIWVFSAGVKTLAEEAPEAYKDVDDVVGVAAGAGISKRVARLRPMGVVKGRGAPIPQRGSDGLAAPRAGNPRYASWRYPLASARPSVARITCTRCRADSGVSSTATRALGPFAPFTKSRFSAYSSGAWNGWSYETQTSRSANHPCAPLPLPWISDRSAIMVHTAMLLSAPQAAFGGMLRYLPRKVNIFFHPSTACSWR